MTDASGRVSRIVLPDPACRYLILFQSWPQFASSLAIIGGCFGVFALVMLSVGDPTLLEPTLTGAAIGTVPSLLLSTRAPFSLHPATGLDREKFTTLLKQWNYVEKNATTEETRFRQNLHRLMRRDECDVVITERDGITTCTGPQMVIRKMRRVPL